ncbi:PREDICTED: uncharacterized protein LOC105462925 [Wasmannia auropunctata]|uniref:uncharacterized protein LOC105462925 n=1 Tax=Wasmannia auropunctata TaxID=64793 RepID=UPI0005EFBC49|nr:PREDICTED: uncharacterized protein LOC105462925 [Wasmannia auropunctata]XP_011708159.1 PREDICTED: uncharacterized protein LOC105462925 [Wasmannia auropunctata]
MPRNSRRNNESTNSLPASRIASEIAGEFLPPPSRIPIAKWQKILEDEHASHVVGFIREEIVRSAADAICENYFRKAVYGFVVNCAYEAWMRAFQWVHLEYDNRGISDGCPVPDEAPPLVAKHPRLPRGVPTVYGRLAKLIASQKSSNRRFREAPCATSALHGRSGTLREGRLRTKIRN